MTPQPWFLPLTFYLKKISFLFFSFSKVFKVENFLYPFLYLYRALFWFVIYTKKFETLTMSSSSRYPMNSVLFSLLFLFVLVAKVSFCFSTKVNSKLVSFLLLFWFWYWFVNHGVEILIEFQVYVVYMGSKSLEYPDDILKENHQILASVHSGRLEILLLSMKPWHKHKHLIEHYDTDINTSTL